METEAPPAQPRPGQGLQADHETQASGKSAVGAKCHCTSKSPFNNRSVQVTDQTSEIRMLGCESQASIVFEDLHVIQVILIGSEVWKSLEM